MYWSSALAGRAGRPSGHCQFRAAGKRAAAQRGRTQQRRHKLPRVRHVEQYARTQRERKRLRQLAEVEVNLRASTVSTFGAPYGQHSSASQTHLGREQGRELALRERVVLGEGLHSRQGGCNLRPVRVNHFQQATQRSALQRRLRLVEQR